MNISVGARHVIARVMGAQSLLWSWGENTDFKLGMYRVPNSVSAGMESATNPNVAYWELAITNLILVSAGENFSLGLSSYGDIYGMGAFSDGQNNGNNGWNYGVAAIGGLPYIHRISAGSTFAVAVNTIDKQVWSWGGNYVGQLGRAVAGGSNTVGNSGLIDLSMISDLTDARACFLTTHFLTESGRLWNCGLNTYGQLGRDTVSGSVTSVNIGEVIFP
jgi:alpha-tubulin suppressor-like RCC1 family protein